MTDVTAPRYAGLSRADLLPTEIRTQAAVKATRRVVFLLLLLAILVVAAAVAYVFTLTLNSQAALADEEARTSDLMLKQAEYQSVRQLQQQVAAADAIHEVTTATSVAWLPLLKEIAADLPSTAFLEEISVTAQSPMVSVAQGAGPFAATRFGTIVLVLRGIDPHDLADYVETLRADERFVEVRALLLEEGGTKTEVTLSLSPSLVTRVAEEDEG